jgi:hypothetical protein
VILGTVGGASLEIKASRADEASPGDRASLQDTGGFTIPLAELADVHRATLPALFG